MTEWDLAEARRSRVSRVIDVREQASCAAGTGARCLPSPIDPWTSRVHRRGGLWQTTFHYVE